MSKVFGFADLAFASLWTPGGPGGLPEIGDPFEGGFFAGLISHTADGNPTHALIVAPRATGASGAGYPISTNLQWKTTATATAGTSSFFDGKANTDAIIAAGISDHPAANFCVNLNINGFDDWYLPAAAEMAIAYVNLKPTTTLNSTAFGVNDYSVPKRTSNYTTSDPSQTSVAAFITSSTEHFQAVEHKSSTESTATLAFNNSFNNGSIATSNGFKTNVARVRAFRRVAL